MSNLSRLQEAGIIAANASFSSSDQQIIDSLTDDEVSALISIKQKVPDSFLQQHVGASGSAAAGIAPASRTIGIVF
jgi:hypothetical protein